MDDLKLSEFQRANIRKIVKRIGGGVAEKSIVGVDNLTSTD